MYRDQHGLLHFSNAPADPSYQRWAPSAAGFRVSSHVLAQDRARRKAFDPLIADAAQRNRVDPALVKAVIRAESDFVPFARSPKGALGLMQLMPATAKSIATRIGLPYSKPRLTTDPTYNISLGRAYLDGLISDYGGSYVLAIAGYNAGPGRVAEWISQNRDPRLSSVDVVDWVESIPISETRNYVQRVLENVQVYRHRIGGTQIALSIEQDLRR
jgi:soluble lytic murein transglycosylase